MWWWIGVLGAAAAGLALRLYRLDEQVLTGDELHSVNGALSRSVGEILRTWTYHGADYSVPLTAAYRFLMDRGVVFDETAFRLPVLVAGALLAPVLAWTWRRGPLRGFGADGDRASLLLAWLLALSPMLVLYGRIVRSYALVVLLASLALLAFHAWWTRRSRPAAVAYVALAALSTWLHLGAAPFVLAPFGLAAVAALREPDRWRAHVARAAALLGITAAAVAALLAPAAASLRELADLHGAGVAPRLDTWLEVARLQVGSRSYLVVALVLLAAGRGAALVWRRDRDLALLLLLVAAGHVAGLVVLAPNFLHALVVANRYVLVLLPVVLALAALGLATPLSASPAARRAQAAAAVALLLALFATGPLASEEYRWSSYTHAQPFLNFTRPGDRIPDEHVPRFYRELPSGDGALLEAPWTNVGTHSFNAYQRVHRRPLRVATIDKLHGDPRLALRNMVPARSDALRASGARFLVVHLDLRREERHVSTSELRHAERLDGLPELWKVLRFAGRRLAAALEREWGPPVYSDDSIRVWDLGALSTDSSAPR